MRAWCRWCRFRIRWYPRWGAWGTYTGDEDFATRCLNSPTGSEEHQPVEEKPDDT